MEISSIVFAAIAILAMVGGFLANRAGATKDLVDAATGLVTPLQERVERLEARVRELETQTTALELWGRALAEQVKQLGGVPVPLEEFLYQVTHGTLPNPS